MSVSGYKAESSRSQALCYDQQYIKRKHESCYRGSCRSESVPSSSNISHGIAAAVDPKSVPSSSTSTGGQRSESQELRELIKF